MLSNDTMNLEERECKRQDALEDLKEFWDAFQGAHSHRCVAWEMIRLKALWEWQLYVCGGHSLLRLVLS